MVHGIWIQVVVVGVSVGRKQRCGCPSDVTFSQLLEKAYLVTKVSRDDFEIEMTSWLTYQYKDSLPPCPIINEDDVQLLIHVNTDKFLSAPLCLVTKLRDNQVSTQSKKEQNESESSNRFAEVVAPIGTIVPETQPQFIPVIPEHRVAHEAAVEPPRVVCQQGTCINLNKDPHPDDDENVEHFYDYELEAELEETNPFFFDDLDGTLYRWSGPNGEKAPVASTEARPVNVIPTQEKDLSPPLNEIVVDLGMNGPLTKWAEKRVLKRDELARRFNVRTLHHYTFEVLDGQKNAVVDLNGKTCTCRRFQLDQMACAHALAATSKINVPKFGLACPYYTSEYLLQAYAEPIYPVGHEDYWKTPEEVSSTIILAPIMRRPSGRPRKLRIASQREEVVAKKSKHCKKTGHNCRTCKNPAPTND
ncbi:hypothetical protein DH2020_044147 [Rehmannia glutinosa]|uniref:SWIM-type domain-containing protein n=1 Tax=Rehmannia glutinosa TaxID=99300 RepID=A0ABR0UJE1_REHGL